MINVALLAYLDPGTGSALVGTLLALAGAMIFSAKSMFYRLFKGKEFAAQSYGDDTIVIFSEGKNYWGTFRPIVTELIRRKIHFKYYTMDLFDPALQIDDAFMHSRLYDKNSASSFAKLSQLKAPVVLATTPNIGSPGYPLKRSVHIKKLIHVFHAFADISAYNKGSLDHYDAVIMVGDHQIEPIRAVEKARGIREKELISLGLPYIDDQYHCLDIDKSPAANKAKAKTVLVASSWGGKGCLREYGTGFINELATAGYSVIVRPHPQSFVSEPDFIEDCMRKTLGRTNIRWDSSAIGSVAMNESDVLISDTSSIRFDYAFLYGKPVISLEIPRERQDAYESVYMKKVWADEAGRKIGVLVDKQTINKLNKIVESITEEHNAQELASYRNKIITNLGRSAEAIVKYLDEETKTAILTWEGEHHA